ncbi:hypothetical protein M8818_007146 [Zalaria obscura]|uniref:Uncharacterized protein n=1 Tax=Zalaria obscura TaxID=2024903 RepID=A0ACC3S4S3_9PEZI
MGSMAGEAGPSHQQQGFSYHRHSSHADDVGPRVEQAAEEDIWLTSESEGENAAQQRQRRRQLQKRASRAPVGHAVGEDEQEQMVHTAQEPSLADRMRFSISSATNEPPPQLVTRTSMPLPAHLTAGFSSSSSATSTSDFESASLGPASDVAAQPHAQHPPVQFRHPSFGAPPPRDFGTGMTTEDEELYTAREQLSPRFEPSGRDINVLFPRTSSSRDTLPSPTGEGATSGKGKGKARARARASQGALGGLAANTVDGRERRDTDARRHYQQGHHQQQDKGKERRRSRPAEVEVYEDYDDAAAGRRGSRIGSRGMTTGHGDSEAECGTCVETGREVKELRHEVARLKVEMIAMKAALRQAGVRGPLSRALFAGFTIDGSRAVSTQTFDLDAP